MNRRSKHLTNYALLFGLFFVATIPITYTLSATVYVAEQFSMIANKEERLNLGAAINTLSVDRHPYKIRENLFIAYQDNKISCSDNPYQKFSVLDSLSEKSRSFYLMEPRRYCFKFSDGSFFSYVNTFENGYPAEVFTIERYEDISTRFRDVLSSFSNDYIIENSNTGATFKRVSHFHAESDHSMLSPYKNKKYLDNVPDIEINDLGRVTHIIFDHSSHHIAKEVSDSLQKSATIKLMEIFALLSLLLALMPNKIYDMRVPVLGVITTTNRFRLFIRTTLPLILVPISSIVLSSNLTFYILNGKIMGVFDPIHILTAYIFVY